MSDEIVIEKVLNDLSDIRLTIASLTDEINEWRKHMERMQDQIDAIKARIVHPSEN